MTHQQLSLFPPAAPTQKDADIATEIVNLGVKAGLSSNDALELGHKFVSLSRRLLKEWVEEYQATTNPTETETLEKQAAFELGRRLLMASSHDRPQVRSPSDAANLLMAEMSVLEQEHVRVILLGCKNYVLGTPTIHVGSVDTTDVRIPELFREAIRVNAVAIIVAHNHPSGDPSPSPDDVAVTEAIYRAGQLVDIEVIDHVIIGQGRYVSMKERGLGFP